jgi:hypothetical protein
VQQNKMPGTSKDTVNSVELNVLESKQETPDDGEDDDKKTTKSVSRQRLYRRDNPKKRKSATPSISSLYSLTSIKPSVDSPQNPEPNVSYYKDPKTGVVIELNKNYLTTTCSQKSSSDNLEEIDEKMRRYSYARSSIGEQAQNSAFKASLLTVLEKFGMFKRPRPSRSTSRLSSANENDLSNDNEDPRFMDNLEDMAANFIFGGMFKNAL